MQNRDKKNEDQGASNNVSDFADAPVVTVGNLVKWVSVVFTVVTMIVSGVWFVASVKQDGMLLKQQVDTLQVKINDVDKLSLTRNDAQEKEIQELTSRTNNTEKAVQDMARKLDVAVALLERIDAKVGKP